MDKILTWGCKVNPRRVPNIWPIYETGRANILKQHSISDQLLPFYLYNSNAGTLLIKFGSS